MTARILVVDDVPTNVKLLEARLMAEYFQVLTATNGLDALQICAEGKCDIVLLDVMMPEMDGFEVCKRLKSDPATMHLPVVMVTALDSDEDRIRGLEAGADDFLTKPVNDLALVTRVKSLARLKMVTDDLRLRAANGDELAIDSFKSVEALHREADGGRIAVIDSHADENSAIIRALSQAYHVDLISNPHDALIQVVDGDYDLVIVSLALEGHDSLRLCSHLRSLERIRSVPIIVTSSIGQDELVSRSLEIGVNDFVQLPLDKHELLARLRTQLLRKRYNDCLRKSVQQTIEMAVKDPLTGLHNRRYFDNQFKTLFEKAIASKEPLSLIICDIDHFKAVNDTHGHDVGDLVIKACARMIEENIRGVDLACRFGGEEFVIAMPETDELGAVQIAERIRTEISAAPISAGEGTKPVPITISLGIGSLEVEENDTPQKLLKRADLALYQAKRGGRNRVSTLAA